jgi:hypothetical protein
MADLGVGSGEAPACAPRSGAERNHPWPYHFLIRAGFAARGVTYVIIGLLTLALALGGGTLGATADQQGALALTARTLVGRLALIGVAVGLLAYAVWKLEQGVRGVGPEGGGSTALRDRVGNLSGGVAYLVFFAVAVTAVAGSDRDSSSAHHAAAGVLGWPAGPLLVGGGGLILIVVSLVQIYDAVRGSFAHECKMDEMKDEQHRYFLCVGRVGLIARAAVFALVGYFLFRTAIDYNPSSAVGVDGALQRLRHEPLGPWLVGLTAAGLLTFAGFSFLEGRYRQL